MGVLGACCAMGIFEFVCVGVIITNKNYKISELR